MSDKFYSAIEIMGEESLICFNAYCTKPKIIITNEQLSYINGPWVPRRMQWENLEMTALGYGKFTKEINSWINDSVRCMANSYYSIAIKKNIVIRIIDATGVVVEKYTLIGAHISKCISADLGQGDNNYKYGKIVLNKKKIITRMVLIEKNNHVVYSDEETIELKFDRAFLENG